MKSLLLRSHRLQNSLELDVFSPKHISYEVVPFRYFQILFHFTKAFLSLVNETAIIIKRKCKTVSIISGF